MVDWKTPSRRALVLLLVVTSVAGVAAVAAGEYLIAPPANAPAAGPSDVGPGPAGPMGGHHCSGHGGHHDHPMGWFW